MAGGGYKKGQAAPKKGKLLKKMAKVSGTTVGEAQGVMKQARAAIRSGNRASAKKSIAGMLTGGPTAGRTTKQAPAAKAEKKATHVVKRIAKKQRGK